MTARILIADDDDEIRELIKFFLEQEGYKITEAQNGEEVINMVYKNPPELILLDVMMPKLTGYEVCERLRSNAKTCLIPIIMLTSLAQTKDKITGIKLGADEYMTKPFENMELVTRIESLLRRYRENKATSPLTGLPGNVALENDIKGKLIESSAFSVLLVDVNNFKIYNDKYSFEQGDDLLRVLGAIIKSAYTELGSKDDLVVYLGEDNFAVVSDPKRSELVAIKIIENYESIMAKFYDADVLQRGYIWTKSESGEEIKCPLLTISIGVFNVEPGAVKHYSQVMDKTKKLLIEAKKNTQSSYCKG
ncbi:MAG: response regulator [bacterium]